MAGNLKKTTTKNKQTNKNPQTVGRGNRQLTPACPLDREREVASAQ